MTLDGLSYAYCAVCGRLVVIKEAHRTACAEGHEVSIGMVRGVQAKHAKDGQPPPPEVPQETWRDREPLL